MTGEAIQTVGVYLTEDERELLVMLERDLGTREESALRSSEGPEAQTCAATCAALRKLMDLPAVQPLNAERVRAAICEACEMADPYKPDDRDRRRYDAIADRVVSQLVSGALEFDDTDRKALRWMRDFIESNTEQHDRDAGCALGLLERIALLPGVCDEITGGLIDLTADREQTQALLDRIGVFDVSHSTERELLAVIRKLCECMIEEGLGEDDL